MQVLEDIKKRSPKPPKDYLSALPDLAVDRMVGTLEAAAFCGYSTSHWRQMFRTGQAPPPIRLSARKLGWKISTLRAWIAAKEATAA
jgi:predicted DNA-binding transcriptional regulator AlpA